MLFLDKNLYFYKPKEVLIDEYNTLHHQILISQFKFVHYRPYAQFCRT